MERQNLYCAQDMEWMLQCLAPIFDVVRLVDPAHTTVLRLCDGRVTEESVVRWKVEDLRQALMPVLPADYGYAYTNQFLAEQSFLMAMLDQADCRMYEEKRRSGQTENRNMPVTV